MPGFIDFLASFDDEPVPAVARWDAQARQTPVVQPGFRLDLDVGPGGSRPVPLHHRSRNGWEVWCLGELWPAGPGDESGPASGLGAFTDGLARGDARPDRLNGHFVVVSVEGGPGRLHVWTDRFGTYHAYHARDGRRAAVGTYLPAVAAAGSTRRLDWLGLTGFLGLGFFPQDRTFFDDVRILRPATHYVFDASGCLVAQERYWRWRHAPDWGRSYDETVDEFAVRFGRVMADHAGDGRVAVPISGGLDSRSTVVPLGPPGADQSGASPWSFSYGYTERSVETSIARRVARARGLPFQALAVRPYLFDRIGDVLRSVEGFQDLTLSRQVSAAREVGQHADRVIAAHWGDVWHDETGLAGAGRVDEAGLLEHALNKFRKRGRAWLLENVCRPRVRGDDPESVLEGLLRPELESLRAIEDPDFRIKALKTEQWSFRWTTASLRSYQLGAFPRLPFYDTRLTNFFATVPTEFVAGRRLQIDYLKRYAPDLARITWQACGTSLYRHRSARSWSLPARAVAKARRVLSRQPAIQRNWEVQFRGDAGRRGLESWLLRPGLRLHEFVAPAAVRGLLNNFAADPSGANGFTVSMLLTLSAWLEHHG